MTLGSLRHRATLMPLVAVLSLVAGRARAQSGGASVELDQCPSELGAAVESALDVELSAASLDARRALADGTLRCALACDETGITAIVTRGVDRIEQRVESRGSGAPRRLAIALGELLEASSVPAPTADAPAVSPPSPAPPAPTPPERVPLRARLRLAGGVWLGGEPFVALGTLALGAEISPTPNVAIVLDASGALGAVSVTAARLDVRLLSAGLSLRLGGDVGPLWLGGGPALRGGAVLWTGTPHDPALGLGRDAIGGWLGVGAVAVAFVPLPDLPLRVGIEAEGGGIAVYSGALVLDALAQRIGGGWLELRIAADLTFE